MKGNRLYQGKAKVVHETDRRDLGGVEEAYREVLGRLEAPEGTVQ